MKHTGGCLTLLSVTFVLTMIYKGMYTKNSQLHREAFGKTHRVTDPID